MDNKKQFQCSKYNPYIIICTTFLIFKGTNFLTSNDTKEGKIQIIFRKSQPMDRSLSLCVDQLLTTLF